MRLTRHCGLKQQAFASVSWGQPSPRDAWDGVSKTLVERSIGADVLEMEVSDSAVSQTP